MANIADTSWRISQQLIIPPIFFIKKIPNKKIKRKIIMATLNKKNHSTLKTHEGAPAKKISAELQLRRSIMSCMLWEDSFYENGESIANRIESLISKIDPQKVALMAIEAREKYKLRHIPLFLVRILAKLKYPIAEVLAKIIQRPDELTKFLEIYWKDSRQPLSAQVKKGLSKAFVKFNEYQLAKYNRKKAVKLRDVLFLCHAKPINEEQAALWKRLINNQLAIPDTWETALSSGKDKKETWERLLKEEKLGGLALLRNLRNMNCSQVDKNLIKKSISEIHTERILPFRFIEASKHAPQFKEELEKVLFKCLEGFDLLNGKTALVIDVSASMTAALSSQSELKRLDAACGVAILLREICDKTEIFTFSNELIQIAPRRGFALKDAIINSQRHHGTYLGKAIHTINKTTTYDRIIVITDEQSADTVPSPKGKAYMINVAPFKNGVGYGKWIHLDGFSENVINWIIEYEKNL